MSGSIVDVTTRDGVADCYLTGLGDGPLPGVLLMIDAIGLRPRIKEMADRIAAQGYVVLAPNVFYRGGRAPLWDPPNLNDAESRAAFMQTLGPAVAELTPTAVAADGDAYLEELGEQSVGPMAITGYCLGGRLGWQIAAAHPDRVAALGGFHTGNMVTEQPESPHLLAPHVQAEVYWGHADNDPNMTPAQIVVLDQAMDDAGVRHTTEVYDDAQHGYTMSDTAVYNEAAAERHFTALFELLGRTTPAEKV